MFGANRLEQNIKDKYVKMVCRIYSMKCCLHLAFLLTIHLLLKYVFDIPFHQF